MAQIVTNAYPLIITYWLEYIRLDEIILYYIIILKIIKYHMEGSKDFIVYFNMLYYFYKKK